MNMKCRLLLLLCFALNCFQGVCAENNHDVKRGMHSFMAFIYYSDPTVVDNTGQRFSRSAVLIRPDWLITTAIGPSLMDPPNGFPKKTLLARAGAITIDSKFTLNEDEDEQEREIVQIVRPYNHSATQWWTTDISLMKTLLAFNVTSAVGIQTLKLQEVHLIELKACYILVFAKKYSNSTEDKSLIMLYVDLLPPSINNCGSHFTDDTMVCATDSDENKDAIYDQEFCRGNSGGPLICSNDVVALQTYIGNDCKQPHLYQLISPWENFITCGIEDKCQEEQCGAICDVIYKDPPKTQALITPPVTHDTARDIIAFLNVPSTTTIETTTTESISVNAPTVTSVTTTGTYSTYSEPVTEVTTNIIPTDVTTTKETEATTPDTTTNMNSSIPESTFTEPMETSTLSSEQTSQVPTTENITTSWPKVKEEEKTTAYAETVSMSDHRVWPKEKLTGGKRDDEEVERKTEVEARHAPADDSLARLYSASNRNLSIFQIVLFGFIVLLCL